MDYKKLRVYVIDWKKLDGGRKFSSARDCVDVMYDEFRLNACVRDGKISVRTNSDREVDKIERFMRKYGADKTYIDSVMSSDKPRIRKKTDESVQINGKNKMPMQMAKYTLNEKFDHRSDGVLDVSISELVRMIPALLRNGKKVVVFVFDGLVDDVRKALAKNMPSLQGKVGVTTFDKLADTCTREALSGTVTEITPDIYVNDSVRNVFITTFHDDGVNYVKFSPDFGRKCACFVVGADMTDGIQVSRRPDSVSQYRKTDAYRDENKRISGIPADDQGVQESARTMSGVRRRKINESKLNMRSNRLNESRGGRNADANLAGRRFVDMLVNESGYGMNHQPDPEEYCNLLLNVKEFVINESYGHYDGKKFVDLASYLTHDKLGMAGVTKKPGYSAVVGDKMFNTPSLNESIRYFSRALRLNEAVDVNGGDSRSNRYARQNHVVAESARPGAPKSDFGAKSVDGAKLKEYKLSDLADLLADKKAQLSDQKKNLRSEKDERKAARIQKLIDKIQNEIDMIKNEISFRKKNKMNESVRSRFGRYRRVFESDSDDDKDDDSFEDMFKDLRDDNDTDNTDDTDDDDKKGSDDADEDVPMTAVLVKVAKEDVDKAKRQMIEAGVEEDDIDVVDNDDDDEDVEIKVDANSIMALKDWLDTKGIDLEDKLGGEIVPPESDDDDKSADEKEPDFDDMDFDDIFGKDEKDSKKEDK